MPCNLTKSQLVEEVNSLRDSLKATLTRGALDLDEAYARSKAESEKFQRELEALRQDNRRLSEKVTSLEDKLRTVRTLTTALGDVASHSAESATNDYLRSLTSNFKSLYKRL
jgi:predicted nuclease with TOPRIM domain